MTVPVSAKEPGGEGAAIAPDPRVLGELLATPALLLMLPTAERIAELAARAVSYVPGVSLACVRSGAIAARSGPSAAPCPDCPFSRTPEGAQSPCPRESEPSYRVFRNSASGVEDLAITCKVPSEETLRPYEPFVLNLAAFLAVVFENRRQREEARRLNEALKEDVEERRQIEATLLEEREHLEETVARRTAQLRAANEELSASEHRLRLLFERSPVALWEEDVTAVLAKLRALREVGVDDIDAHLRAHPELVGECVAALRALDVNARACALSGAVSKAELLVGLPRTFTERSLDAFRTMLVQLAEGATAVSLDSEVQTLQGEPREVSLWLSLISGGEDARALVSIVDITDRKRAEEALHKLSLAVEQSPSTIVITDTEGRIEYVNPRFTEVTGFTSAEAIGQTPRVLKSGKMPDSIYAELWATIHAGKQWRGELCNKRKDGTFFWELASISPLFDAKGRITHYVAVKEDVTERKRLEAELRQAQKMDAFGQLAGGVAHDFNNILTVILGNVSALQDSACPTDELPGMLSEIEGAASRAASLTRQLLTFSRRQIVQMQDVDLNEIVATMTRMLQRLIGEHISLTARYAPVAAPLRADRGMLEQVLVNLVVNARDAMPRGGQLTIETALCELGAEAVRQKPGVAAGAYVRLSVVDTGSGIAPEHVPRIFEPFFTTKDVGKGTGLGLATVFGIVEQHHGFLEVESEVGVGTKMHVYLPRLVGATQERSIRGAARQERGGAETILLVEDEAPVRALARRILERRGYRVLQAGTGVEAQRVFESNRTAIDLLLTDLVMPGGMSGLELGRRLLEERPGLKIVYSSGYTDEVLGEASQLRGGPTFLQKPYGAVELLRVVRQCLDGA